MKSGTTTWIKTRRQLMGITQKQMAEKAGMKALHSVCASECGRRCHFCVQGNRTGEKENAKQVSNSLPTVDTKGKDLSYHTITERKQRPQGGQNNDERNRHALC